MFWSADLVNWKSQTTLNLPRHTIFNTSLCKVGGEKTTDKYVMMFEIGGPPEEAGVRFTARFAESADLKTWKLTPAECAYAKDRYTAPHCLRYLDGYFYNFYLEAHDGYEMRVVRSRDLVHWEPSPLNPVLRHSPEDKKIANPNLTAEQRTIIENAVNRNNSDIDFCEYEGRTVITYSWGNQAVKDTHRFFPQIRFQSVQIGLKLPYDLVRPSQTTERPVVVGWAYKRAHILSNPGRWDDLAAAASVAICQYAALQMALFAPFGKKASQQ